MNERTGGWMIDRMDGWIDRWMDGWMESEMGRRTDGRTEDGRMIK